MARFQITCVKKNDTGDIIQVGLSDGRIFNASDIINDIVTFHIDFYTLTPQGHAATVYAKPPNRSVNHWYLTTHPDGLLPNNLDNLRPCY